MRAVQILINSSQQTSSGRSDLAIEVEGSVTSKGEATYLTYKEPEGTGLDNTTTTLKLEKDKVTLIRNGSTSLKQVFVAGEKTDSLYQTPYGNFPLKVESKDVKVELIKDKGKISLHYDLVIGGEKIQDQKLILVYYSI
ncbi:Uncharacterized beta-barrel protein YwiB, DUF1934 family [Anaerobranca californiensis DSM 14826]|jgi:uncharacterized beta-barrel protein YwiB (DUF1934 family)|uniref:Uncharacterized beta-barrel protein YwiB, DUF1934 family n=1 Tax=Anaerobranca californiensis DSM 14826 TaxID=1120989 RepID=A0A1M6M766_9FIRM|nr:DUF1934 domain-containing protein [Anaerobranca californiensis]SHJ79321.1 Uncharacterized beta-barrel protein YwiB, DUF1934 family [Anaerobranca californiensis DSM 14826]